MPSLRFSVVLLTVALFATGTHAQIRQGPSGAVEEDRFGPYPLSGARFRALTNVSPLDTASSLNVVLYVPPLPPNQGPGPLICIRVYDANATYRGRFRYRHPEVPGWYRFTLPTKYTREVEAIGVAGLLPLAYTSYTFRTCSQRHDRDVYLPALFGSDISLGRMRLVLLASGARLNVTAGLRGELPCREAVAKTYSHECLVDLTETRGPLELQVHVRRGPSTITRRMTLWRPR